MVVSLAVMHDGAFTRRSLLAGTAAAAAGGLLRPGGAIAALAGTPPLRVSERWVGDLPAGAVRTLQLAGSADLVGAQWLTPAHTQLRLRFRGAGGAWSPWVSADAHGHGPDAPAPGAAQTGEPVWTGGTRALQLQSAHPVAGLRIHLIDVSDGAGARRLAASAASRLAARASGLALAAPLLPAGPGPAPAIIARRAWAQQQAHPAVAPEYGAVRMAFVHHTENPNGYGAGEVPAMLRAIYGFHRFVNGWNDIGYNFVIDAYGRIFEARAGGVEEPVTGAHAGGYNAYSTGVAVLGSFMSEPIPAGAHAALERLLAWKLSLHGVPAQGRVVVKVTPGGARYSKYPAGARVSLPRIAGHRDGDSTDCPGDALYAQLPGVRPRVARLAARPARLTLALAPAPAVPPVPSPAPGTPGAPASTPAAPAAGSGRSLTGTLTFLDGTPIAGVKVAVQSRTVSRRGEAVLETTIGEALTDAGGAWMLPASFAPARRGGAALRALFAGAATPGAPALPPTISEPLQLLAVAPLSPAVPPVPAPTPAAPAPPAQ
jgi:hypothetical protein